MFEVDETPDPSRLPPEFQAWFSAQATTLEAERQARMAAEAECDRLTVTAAEAAHLQARNARLEEHIARLEHLIQEARQAQFGKRSEKLSPDERQLERCAAPVVAALI